MFLFLPKKKKLYMNKLLNIIYTILLVLGCCIFIDMLFLFYMNIFYIQEMLFETNNNYLVTDDLINFKDSFTDNSSVNSECSCSSCSCRSSNNSNVANTIKLLKVFKDCKNNIKDKTRLVIFKLKKIDRKLSWFFKSSRPGGGRGL